MRSTSTRKAPKFGSRAGKVVGVDIDCQLALVYDQDAVVVLEHGNVSMSLPLNKPPMQVKDVVMVIGLVKSTPSVPPVFASAPLTPNATLVQGKTVECVWYKHCEELDLAKWRQAIEAINT
ncbi:hypothetical protein ACM66B_001337 [Microbotryomycetes sp. NB124-2]